MKYVFSTTLALALLASAPALADGGDKIDVMTQNQYLGADLGPIIGAGTPAEFNFELVEALKTIAANNYRARATKLAELIADRLPELIVHSNALSQVGESRQIRRSAQFRS
jgi:hypothetical protein